MNNKMITKKQANDLAKKIDEKLIKFSFLGKGSHNENYLFQTDKRKYVLRVESNPMFKNLKKEYRILKEIEHLNFGPKVYFIDTSHKIITTDYFLEEFISGKNPKMKVSDSFVKLMANWFKKLHSHKTTKKSKFEGLLASVKPFYNNYKKYNCALDSELSEKIKKLFESAIEICKKEDSIFSNRKNFSILHRDPSKDNVFINKNNVRLIDWEFADIGLPEWEIVYFLRHYKFTDKQKELFLKTYRFPKSGMKKLKILSLLNTCGDIGYSVWRLGLLKNREIQENKEKRLARLNQDIKILGKIISELK